MTLKARLLAVALVATFAHAAMAAPKRPNILLVLSDDHSAAHVGCYGNPDIRTPNLDRFASQGMRFDRAYVASPQCVPSRSAIMTGRSPVAIQMTRFSAPLAAEYPVFPEILRAQGYFSGVAGRTYHLDGAAQLPASKKVFDEHHLRTFPDRLDFVKIAGKGGPILDQFGEFLDAVPQGKPFVLQLCFSDPHRPLDKDAIPEPHDPKKLTLPKHYPDTPLVREDFARYYDEISRFDGDFGRVLKVLDDRKLADDTIVAFMGDNGASQFRGKGTLYEFGIRVPLLVRWPGVVKPGSTSDALVSGEDLAPTFLRASGVAVPGDMTGQDFGPILRGEKPAVRDRIFAERGAHGSGLPNNSAAFDLGRVVVTRRHKLIYNALWQLPYHPVDFAGDDLWKDLRARHEAGTLAPEMSRLYFAEHRPMFELYDLEADPDEFRNLIGTPEAAKVERELKASLQEWMILQRDYLPLPIPPGNRAAAQ
ncbi:sulfatase family protein [Tundrisphaera sp. TA3]|uniref:sulfatase family protein n=1 Tax=Tundrisphaera sp. TA3 TaxID=3435775 RepID=UPI003EBAEC6B